jgi:plastocyanin
MFRVRLFAAIVVMGVAFGCEEKHVEAVARPQPVFGHGVIRGKVMFAGSAPVVRMIRNEPCCDGAPKELADESVVVNEKKELANVVVYLADIPASDGSARAPAVLDQKFCRYTPHVLAVQVGQPLRIVSSDPTIHNVHFSPAANPAGNYGMTAAGSEKTVTFSAPEFIDFRCDVHPWMRARVGVMENPFFGVTKEDGSFEIVKVPAGKYSLKAWHERFGDLDQAVTVAETGAVDVSFVYKE